MSMFRIGQRVVCVDDSPGMFDGKSHLKLRSVYTIRGFCENFHGELGLLLEEVRPDLPRLRNGQERGFYVHRFRPIQERKTDIGFAHEILKKVTRKQTERA